MMMLLTGLFREVPDGRFQIPSVVSGRVPVLPVNPGGGVSVQKENIGAVQMVRTDLPGVGKINVGIGGGPTAARG